MIVQTCLSAPTKVQRRSDVFFWPFHDFAKFVKIVDFLKFQLLNGCSRNNHAVEIFVGNLGKRLVKPVQVAECRMRRFMRFKRHERNVDLQRRIRQSPQKLQFSSLLQRHQVHDCNFDRSNVLMNRTRFVHYENIFLIQDLACRKIMLYFNRHLAYLLVSKTKTPPWKNIFHRDAS